MKRVTRVVATAGLVLSLVAGHAPAPAPSPA